MNRRNDGGTDQGYEEQAPAEAAPAAAPAQPDMAAQIEQLGKLHEEGLLTDEEFEAKKKQILGI